jgi:hypothetical protein
MITIEDLTYDPRISTSVGGMPLVFVIDGQCVYDFPSNRYGSELFFKNKGIVDISDEYPDNDGITVKIIIDEENFEVLKASEYLGSILLSPHLVLCLFDYPFGAYVSSPNATFDGIKFTITDRDMDTLDPHPYEPPFTSSTFFAS